MEFGGARGGRSTCVFFTFTTPAAGPLWSADSFALDRPCVGRPASRICATETRGVTCSSRCTHRSVLALRPPQSVPEIPVAGYFLLKHRTEQLNCRSVLPHPPLPLGHAAATAYRALVYLRVVYPYISYPPVLFSKTQRELVTILVRRVFYIVPFYIY